MIFDCVLVPRAELLRALEDPAALRALIDADPARHWLGVADQLRASVEVLRVPMPITSAQVDPEQRVPWAHYRRFERYREFAGAMRAALKADAALTRVQAEAGGQE